MRSDVLSGLICVQSVNKGNSCYICIFYKMKHAILIHVHINGLHKYEPHRQLKRTGKMDNFKFNKFKLKTAL